MREKVMIAAQPTSETLVVYGSRHQTKEDRESEHAKKQLSGQMLMPVGFRDLGYALCRQ
eukprot:CAMPEP_0172665336 /NCGR_PEP_ID=MMETSP1074-20121228/7188_1 /TAXON_ID=2916 /ORGANISM="Ceratium fusus, Strain PA161109" /LENGTH=58 /DNA_ID=CAMNT_0013481641 /DNA_START=1 /DNA_END=177 /DNA_ORIENTATION=-